MVAVAELLVRVRKLSREQAQRPGVVEHVVLHLYEDVLDRGITQQSPMHEWQP
jgi:hypothetical protein